MWKQREVTDGTYTFADLLVAHEILNTQERNQELYREWVKVNE